MPQVDVLGKLSVSNRDSRGLVHVMPSEERYFGEELRKTAPKGVGAFVMSQSQHLAMELYESRVASMQRFVAMTVMFHQVCYACNNFHFSILSMRFPSPSYPASKLDGNEGGIVLSENFIWATRIQDG